MILLVLTMVDLTRWLIARYATLAIATVLSADNRI
jgi:hypothetical protein